MLKKIRTLLSKVWSTALFWSVMVTVLRSVGFVLVWPVILKQLAADSVGLWYTFSGIASVCSMVELGFSPIISRFTTFYFSGLQGLPGSQGLKEYPRKSEPNLAGIAGLVRMSRRLYLFFALLVLMAMGISFLWLRWKYRMAMSTPLNLGVYVIFSLGMAWSMAGYFWSGLLLGANRVQDYQKIILGGILLSYVVVLLGLRLHWGILSLAISQIALAIYQREKARQIFQSTCPYQEQKWALPIQWHQLWPMTWRGGLMGFGMYFSFCALTLVCAQVFDLSTTGRFALSLQLVIMISGLSGGCVSVKYPVIASLYVQGEYSSIRQLLRQRLIWQMGSYFFLCLLAWKFAPFLLATFGARTNFLEPQWLALLMFVGAFDLLINTLSSVVQCGNEFPFVQSKIANAVLTIVLAFVLGRYWGISGLIVAPLLAQLVYNGWHISGWCWRDLHRLDAIDKPSSLL